MTAIYPTKKEVLDYAKRWPPDSLQIAIVNDWKKKWYINKWKETEKEAKKEALEFLIKELWEISVPEGRLKISIIWDQDWRYYQMTNTIHGDQYNISIISALHELGHSIFGASELSACAFSVGLFKECFPNEYANLIWDGHMLRKP